MKSFRRFALQAFAVAAIGAAISLRADDAPPAAGSAPAAASAFVPPTPEAAAAAGLLPPDKAMDGKKHALLDRWTKAWGLTEEQRLWIEPQLHAEEGLSKPVLNYKALNQDERRQILQIMKLAARRQIRTLLTPEQQKLMDQEIESTKASRPSA
jgi:hypothetical protein